MTENKQMTAVETLREHLLSKFGQISPLGIEYKCANAIIELADEVKTVKNELETPDHINWKKAIEFHKRFKAKFPDTPAAKPNIVAVEPTEDLSEIGILRKFRHLFNEIMTGCSNGEDTVDNWNIWWNKYRELENLESPSPLEDGA